MQVSFWEEIKNFFFRGSALSRLIGLNVLVFLVVSLLRVFFFLFNEHQLSQQLAEWLGISSNVHVLIFRPWTAITYMFLHFDLLHILFNMMVLYVGGRLFSDFIGTERLVPTYLFGGLLGAVFYVVAFNVFPVFSDVVSHSLAIGASASVLSIFVAIAVYMPNYRLPLLLLGTIRLKYIAIFFVVIDIISIDKGNPGGHLAHLGGACWGYFYATLLKSGKDPAKAIGLWFDAIAGIFSRKPHFKVEYTRGRPLSDDDYNEIKVRERKKMDEILDKISRAGYDSLTAEEKNFLFKVGEK
jgi:membrane associated rhomboid family serine protease